jgi:tellurite resistance protein TerC
VGVYYWKGQEDALAFTTAYLLEKALSVDNLFIFLVIFSYFNVADQYRHRVLFWGIMGAIIMRGVLIGAGVALITYFQWLLFVFGGILVVTGIKLAVSKEESYEPSKTLAFRLTRRYVPLTEKYHGQCFFAVEAGRRVATPLFLILVMIETTDLIFALDSIPACLAISQDPFIVYTSNIFAIMGLRALYFVLAGLMASLRFLRPALAAVLVFIGCKMLWEEARKHEYLPAAIAEKLHITTGISLTVVASIIGFAIVASLLWPKREEAGTAEERG